MIPTTVSSSPSTATVSGGTTGNNHSTSNNGQLNTTLSTPTSSSPSISAISPSSAQMPSTILGLASLILEGRAVADDELQSQIIRNIAAVFSDASGLSGSGCGIGEAGGTSSGVGNSLYNFNVSNLLASSTSYGISGNSSGIAVGGGRQSPTCRPSTSRAAASFVGGGGGSGGTVDGPVINITTNPYAFNNSAALSGAHPRDSSPLYIDPYSNSSSSSASSSAESTHQRWTQKLCQLRQVSPAANLSTTYEQPVAVEAREPELVALAINESGANNEREFEIIRRSLLNRTNLNAISSLGSSATAVTGSSVGAGSAGSSPGSGSDNFLYSLQSLATTCLRSGSPSLEVPTHSGMGGASSATGTPSGYRFVTLASTPPSQSMHFYRANTPTATTTAQRFLEQPGSGSSCGSGVQSPRPHWSATMDKSHHSALDAKERYMRHTTSASSLGGVAGRMPIPGTAVNTTAAASAASKNRNNTTKPTMLATATAASSTASKQPQHGPHCDQYLRKMGLAKGEAAEAEDHFCDMSYVNITCSRWRAYCHKIEAIVGRGEPVCIEVYLGPVNHKILLEQWIITQKEKVPPPTMTLPSLCSAIRSQLYFSQISAWCDLIKKSDKTIYDTGRVIFHTRTGAAGDLATRVSNIGGINSNTGSSTTNNITPSSSPSSHVFNNQLKTALSMSRRPRLNIFYRIKSFDSTACFNSKPNVHNFPNVNISENCSISVCLKSLPRINGGIPKIGATAMLNTPGNTTATVTATTTTIATTSTTSTTTTTTTTTMVGMSSKVGTSNKTKTTKAATSSSTTTTATTAIGMTSSTCRLSTSIADIATQRTTNTSNGSYSTNNSDANTLRNGSSYVKSEDTPRSSRPSRCVIANQAAAPNTAVHTARSAVLAPISGVDKSRVFENNATTVGQTPLASSTSTTLCSTNSSRPTINSNETASNGKSCVCAQGSAVNSSCSRVSCAPKHKFMFFIDEDELLAVDEADAEAFDNDDDNTSDVTSTTGDSMTNSYAFGACANISHREKQLMKYRKRMLKRDKKHQHHQRKPVATASDATCELGATLELQRRQKERNEANSCQPMEEGEEEDDEEYAASDCNDTITSVVTRTSARIEMISTGTQTPMSCCRQCGCEKALVCMRCISSNSTGNMRREQVIDDPTDEQDVDDMDDSQASSISSSEIIHTPRNKAELLLQAIQRTPKAAKYKKQEASRKTCSGKLQNNNHLIGVSLGNNSAGITGGKSSSSSSLHENAMSSGCQVCKRQKTQHNFGETNSAAASNAAPNEQLAGETDNDDIGEDTDEDGGTKLDSIDFVAEVAKETEQLPAKPLSAQVMEEESFLSSTKLTPQIERCTLSNTPTKSVRCQLLSVGERTSENPKDADFDRSLNNRTPPIITTMMEGECFDKSQFKTPTTTAGLGISYENAQQQQQTQKASFHHNQTPKPNLLQLHSTYHSELSGSNNEQAVGAAGDGFSVADGKCVLSSANKSHKQPQQSGGHNALLLRKGLPKVNLTPIFCNPMPQSSSGVTITNSQSSPIPIHCAANDNTFSFEAAALNRDGNQIQLQHQLMHSSGGNFYTSPLTTEVSNIPVQKSFSAPTLPNSPSLSPRFAKQAAIYKRRSRHLSDRSDRSSLGSDEQFSDEDLESGGMYSPATSPLKQCARVAAAFGRQPLLGNLEESLLQKRLMPKAEVMGFKVLLGASGGFCPTQLTIPAASYFYELRGESLSTPYVCDIRLPRKGYSVPRAGTVQATLLNPMGTVVRMFVIPYDMRDMPPLHQTFIRQRILAEASTHEATTQNVQTSTTNITNMQQQNSIDNDTMSYTNGFGAGGDINLNVSNNNSDTTKNNIGNNNNGKNKYRLSPSGGLHGESNLGHFISAENMKRLRYSIHLRFQTSRSGRLSLHTDIRLLISRRTDCDTAAAHAKGVLEAPNDLITDTVMPTNPKYSARQDQSSSGSGSGGSSSSTNLIATATNSTTTTNNNNSSSSNKI